ncbi:MAG: hypothetical protein JWP89_4397 [Schlesneria sp.]|nr:hypothetical protein [Schlesneria sp.]
MLLANGTKSQRQGDVQSGTTDVEGTCLHKRGLGSAEDGEVPRRSPQGILDGTGGIPPPKQTQSRRTATV